MPEEIPGAGTGSVMYQRNYDKETQHRIEEDTTELIEKVTGYCTEVGTSSITDAAVVAAVMGKVGGFVQRCKQLYTKYHEEMEDVRDEKTHKIIGKKLTEGYSLLTQFEEQLSTSFIIDGPWLLHNLKAVQKKEIEDIAVKHKLMDRISEKEPWEREVKKKFFPERDT